MNIILRINLLLDALFECPSFKPLRFWEFLDMIEFLENIKLRLQFLTLFCDEMMIILQEKHLGSSSHFALNLLKALHW